MLRSDYVDDRWKREEIAMIGLSGDYATMRNYPLARC